MNKILICDDDQLIHDTILLAISGKYKVVSCYHSDEAYETLQREPIDLILLDIKIRTEHEGLDFLARLQQDGIDIPVIVISGFTDFELVRRAMTLGAADYLPKTFSKDELLLNLEKGLERRRELRRTFQTTREVERSHDRYKIVGESAAVQKLRQMLTRAKFSKANVLITGEAGVGKELVARNLRGSLPSGGLAPFVAVDASTIQHSMAESILFGYEKGAFTGANRSFKGLFEEADGGIIYFDEIANMSAEIQPKLLRAIQEKEITRLGASRPISLDFRVVVATNASLEDKVKENLFRADLLDRLSVVPIHVPPLRERKEDIPELLEHFLGSHRQYRPWLKLSEEATQVLCQYEWPGNIRELSNMVSYLATMVENDLIQVPDLPPKVLQQKNFGGFQETSVDESFYDRMKKYEEQILRKEYGLSQGNLSQMAKRLKMDRSHLYTKLQCYQIHEANKSRRQKLEGEDTTFVTPPFEFPTD